MYLVNTSFAVEPEVHDGWLQIIKERYIPFLEKEGYKIVAFSRVLSVDTPEHFTYSLLLDVPDMESYKRLTEELFGEYANIAGAMFGTSVVWFTSLMKKIDL